MYARIHTCTHTRTHAYMHTCIRAYTHTHIHAHARSHASSDGRTHEPITVCCPQTLIITQEHLSIIMQQSVPTQKLIKQARQIEKYNNMPTGKKSQQSVPLKLSSYSHPLSHSPPQLHTYIYVICTYACMYICMCVCNVLPTYNKYLQQFLRSVFCTRRYDVLLF